MLDGIARRMSRARWKPQCDGMKLDATLCCAVGAVRAREPHAIKRRGRYGAAHDGCGRASGRQESRQETTLAQPWVRQAPSSNPVPRSRCEVHAALRTGSLPYRHPMASPFYDPSTELASYVESYQ